MVSLSSLPSYIFFVFVFLVFFFLFLVVVVVLIGSNLTCKRANWRVGLPLGRARWGGGGEGKWGNLISWWHSHVRTSSRHNYAIIFAMTYFVKIYPMRDSQYFLFSFCLSFCTGHTAWIRIHYVWWFLAHKKGQRTCSRFQIKYCYKPGLFFFCISPGSYFFAFGNFRRFHCVLNNGLRGVKGCIPCISGYTKLILI